MTKRNYGIDLLRLVLMYMVCILHVLGRGGILALGSSVGKIECAVFMLIETFAYFAVDAFAIISGYMASYDKPLRPRKIIGMWFQVFFYSFAVTAIFALFGLYSDFSGKAVMGAVFPLTFGTFWYFTSYFAVFLFAPIINRFISDMSENTAKKIFIAFFLIFSVAESVNFAFKTAGGYSGIWLIVLYILGASAKKANLFAEKKTWILILFSALCLAATWLLFIFAKADRFLSYVSPTMTLPALLTVIVFSRMKIKGKIVSKISPLAFGIYLFQLSPAVWALLDGATAKLLSENSAVAVLQVFLFSAILWTAGLLVDFIRSLLFRLLHIKEFSAFLEKVADRGIRRLFPILK